MTIRKVSLSPLCLGLVGLLAVGCTGMLEPLGEGGGGPGPGPDAAGPPDPPPDPGDSPQALFLNDVRGRFSSTCTPCHVEGGTQPDFLAASADDYYDRIMGGYPSELIGLNTDDSRLYTKGLTPHAGSVQWAPEDLAALDAWIVAEYDYRTNADGDGGTPVPDPDPVAECEGETAAACALERFGTCFSWQRWTELELYKVSDNNTSQGPCRGCHSTGTGAFWASGDSLQMYTKWKTSPYVTKLVEASIDADGEFGGLFEAHRISKKGNEPGHPSFVLEAPGQSIDLFVRETLSRYEAGNCQDDPGGA